MMGQLSAWAEGVGQDMVTTAILVLALLMLAWHCIWVSTQSYQMTQTAKQLGRSAVQGERTLWALAIAVALSVLREGAETILFVSGLVAGSTEGQGAMLINVVLGLSCGGMVGWLIYTSLGKIKPQRLFAVTNTLMVLLAGSLASQLAKTLNQANWLVALDESAWNVAAWLPNESLLGMILHGVLGFDPNPSWLQLVFYVTTTLLIGSAASYMKYQKARY
jgi:high-affinity iron transporter